MTLRKSCSPAAGYRCPCCQFRTLHERGGFELCPVCFWEDDGQDDQDACNIRGGPTASFRSPKRAKTSNDVARQIHHFSRLFDRHIKRSVSSDVSEVDGQCSGRSKSKEVSIADDRAALFRCCDRTLVGRRIGERSHAPK